jgi:hypothetical protein
LDDVEMDFRIMGVKRWKRTALDRTEWAFVAGEDMAELKRL